MFLSLALLAAQPAAAESPFNGTWLIDLGSIERRPEITIFALRNGVFSRAGHGRGFAVMADGRIHGIAGDVYVDAVAVTVLGPRRVREIDRLRGRIVYSVTYDVSRYGTTMTARVVDWGKPDHKPITTVVTRARIGRAGPGSPLNGRWQETGAKTTRGHRTDRFRLVGNRISDTGPGGYGYEAVIGGPAAPVRGDVASAETAVTMPDEHTIVERSFVNGAPTFTKTMTLMPDGRAIRVVGRRQGETADVVWMLRRQ